jgi:hypothetical protein
MKKPMWEDVLDSNGTNFSLRRMNTENRERNQTLMPMTLQPVFTRQIADKLPHANLSESVELLKRPESGQKNIFHGDRESCVE